MVKSASFNSSESLMWKSGLVGAILGSLIPKIGEFSEYLTFSVKTVDMNWANWVIIGCLLLDILMPVISWIISVFMGLSMSYTWRFYFLFFYCFNNVLFNHEST